MKLFCSYESKRFPMEQPTFYVEQLRAFRGHVLHTFSFDAIPSRGLILGGPESGADIAILPSKDSWSVSPRHLLIRFDDDGDEIRIWAEPTTFGFFDEHGAEIPCLTLKEGVVLAAAGCQWLRFRAEYKL